MNTHNQDIKDGRNIKNMYIINSIFTIHIKNILVLMKLNRRWFINPHKRGSYNFSRMHKEVLALVFNNIYNFLNSSFKIVRFTPCLQNNKSSNRFIPLSTVFSNSPCESNSFTIILETSFVAKDTPPVNVAKTIAVLAINSFLLSHSFKMFFLMFLYCFLTIFTDFLE